MTTQCTCLTLSADSFRLELYQVQAFRQCVEEWPSYHAELRRSVQPQVSPHATRSSRASDMLHRSASSAQVVAFDRPSDAAAFRTMLPITGCRAGSWWSGPVSFKTAVSTQKGNSVPRLEVERSMSALKARLFTENMIVQGQSCD